ncbi:MAG: class I SAM-dependent methyltransferase [Rhodospirillaceae bacterium]|nr:class I SAM-dependent methyltransferase [Rhodospirillaceae bacterium]MBT4042547.1 class I SAM-dependent methyltransferase [Rhodospirillaceae bacterium]MBT4489741.1 class I SAM-dependent methyltransferase [Rhodospirillaceae bacterium]MBT4687027.1 class I SAM-dependent methyltransferase [Rhodospirillaceae bacterium]MBT5881590.1 class I SAM-dependent methyltransferase [Rhodospirillaceae bacterium]
MATNARTDFGFEQIPPEEKTARVRGVFNSVASRYDLMNDVMSGGLHRLWKAAFITWLRPRRNMRLLDLAGGTGDIAFRFLRAGGGTVAVADINLEMLLVGQERARKQRLGGAIEWLCANGEVLPIPDSSMDVVTCAFGIRNMTDKSAALAEIHRILKPGGRFMCLEFSRLALPGLEKLYDKYSFEVVPQLGRLVANDEASYRYLAESIRTFPDQDAFADMISHAGFSKVKYRNLAGGIAAMHSAWRI